MKRVFLALALIAPAPAAPVIEKMKSQAVFIVAEYASEGKKGASLGSGFPVDATHVITNAHVCCPIKPGPDLKIAIIVSEKEAVFVTKVLGAGYKDLAILELEKPLSITPPALAPRKLLTEGQDLWVVGFPGASRNVSDAAGALVPSISKGILSKFLSSPGSTKDEPPVNHIQTTAAVNSGNSGGPMFDGCGRVAGVVVSKALVSLDKKKAFAEGVNLAIAIDELIVELDRLKIPYTAASDACAPASETSSGAISLTQGVTVALAAMALFVSFNKRARTAVTNAATIRLGFRAATPRPAHAAPKRMMLRCVAGPFAGQKIPLSSKPCVIGRDAAVANLVFPHDAVQVSKRHCQLTCDAQGEVSLEDSWSSNGTFTGSGQRIAAGQRCKLQAGEKFYLGSRDNLFEVVAE